MRVLAEILEDLFGSGERALGVDHPLLVVERVLQSAEGLRIRQLRTRTSEVEFAPFIATGKSIEELAAEQSGQHANGEQVLLAAGDPAVALRRESTAGDDAVDMRMEPQIAG